MTSRSSPATVPAAAEAFDTALTLTPRVDRYARVMVRNNQYSVPATLIGRRVRVRLTASEVVAHDGSRQVARHARCPGKGGQVLVLDHYLEVLARKPGALPGATALAQARAARMFTAEHEAFWAAARAAHGDSGGTRALVEVLLLHRHLTAGQVTAGIRAALAVGALNADVVAIEARKHPAASPARPGRRSCSPCPTGLPSPGQPGRCRRGRAPAAQRRGLRRAAHQPGQPPGGGVVTAPRWGHRTRRRCLHRRRPARMLRLPTIRSRFPELADAAAREQMTYRAFLSELLLAECDDRDERRRARRIRDAAFPRDKQLADFDYTANPAVDPR